MTAIELPEVRLRGRTILRPGDLIRVGAGQARYTVQRIIRTSSGAIEVHAYGGKLGRLSGRIFSTDEVTRCRTNRDPNAGYREALHEVSIQSKKRKSGARR